MTDRNLLRALGVAAVLGGLLRIGSAFVPWTPGSAALELFYFVIDVLLLFGLMGVYLAHREQLGIFGFFPFVVAETGIASIVGPDATVFGVDTYASGVVVIQPASRCSRSRCSPGGSVRAGRRHAGSLLSSLALPARRRGKPSWGSSQVASRSGSASSVRALRCTSRVATSLEHQPRSSAGTCSSPGTGSVAKFEREVRLLS